LLSSIQTNAAFRLAAKTVRIDCPLGALFICKEKMLKTSNKPLRIAVIGAGVRGTSLARKLSFSEFSTKIVAVAEPNWDRRTTFAREYALPENAQFPSWQAFTDSSMMCDAVIIATMDNQHTGPAVACLQRGWHILIEKPLADTFAGCQLIESTQRETDLVVSVCHTLRYMDAFRRIKQIIDDGVLGQLIHIEHMEAIDHIRFTHNYVRGRWSKEENNTFLLLHKCCHDVDFLAWLIDDECSRVSSFGSLTYFTPSNAPEGSGKRCLQNCRLTDSCPYSALRIYIDADLTDWLQDLGNVDTREDRLKAIKHGPFGVCVWQADNNVVDHQVVSMEFLNGTTATCTLSGYSAIHERRTRIQGTKAELLFSEATDTITIRKFSESEPEYIQVQRLDSYHPEDQEIVDNWLSVIFDPLSKRMTVDAKEALRTLAMVFAAELSRKENRTVEMEEFFSERG
jgi:predicted dehydrogenase